MNDSFLFMAKAQLALKGELSITLRGKSMNPLLMDGDVAHIVPCLALSVGKIYAFFQEDKTLIVHRLVGRSNQHLVFKGDHASRFDLVSKEDILGEVDYVIFAASNQQCEYRLSVSSSGVVHAWLSKQIGLTFYSGKTPTAPITKRILAKALDFTNKVYRQLRKSAQ